MTIEKSNAARAALAEARHIVIKLGTALLTGGTGTLDRAFMVDLARELAALVEQGRRIVVVSSGAVAAGMTPMGLRTRPSDLSLQQAAAAAGQPMLMDMWREAFAVRRKPVAQLLVTREDLDDRERFLNIRNCAAALHEHGVIPIVNENDTVATAEIALGDNDVLAARLAVAVQADALLLLTSVPGVQDVGGTVVSLADSADTLAALARRDKSAQGRGGMHTKVEASRIVTESGIVAIIGPGRPADNVRAILRGDDLGTAVLAKPVRHVGRKRWLAASTTPRGALRIDAGAVRAVVERGASLLPRGIAAVSGRFDVGDVVAVHDDAGREVARGLSNYTSDDVGRIMGKGADDLASVLGHAAHEEVIHRDNLVIVNRGNPR